MVQQLMGATLAAINLDLFFPQLLQMNQLGPSFEQMASNLNFGVQRT